MKKPPPNKQTIVTEVTCEFLKFGQNIRQITAGAMSMSTSQFY